MIAQDLSWVQRTFTKNNNNNSRLKYTHNENNRKRVLNKDTIQ